uniref:Uncharacterized protein n=1 Tax=Anguilla anguilla TaxID=7936 RepID=A0A0E9TYV5_ANGAN
MSAAVLATVPEVWSEHLPSSMQSETVQLAGVIADMKMPKPAVPTQKKGRLADLLRRPTAQS